jgi:dephospho-CoA kinase
MNLRRIGISGFMGAGKTTCRGLLSAALKGTYPKIRIVDADAEAKRIMRTDETIRNKLAASFGKTIISDKDILFSSLGSIVFGSLSQLRILNEIVYPVLLEKFKELIFFRDEGCVIFDAALIPLWHVEEWFDMLLWVRSPFEKRQQRLMNKLHLPADVVAGRLRIQEQLMPEPHQSPWRIINNQGTIEELRQSVFSITEGEEK